jgi:hypothetical protein
MANAENTRELVDLRFRRHGEKTDVLTTHLDIHSEKRLEHDLRRHLENYLHRRRKPVKDFELYEIEVAPALAKSQPRGEHDPYFTYIPPVEDS